jgi:hypothetical protein
MDTHYMFKQLAAIAILTGAAISAFATDIQASANIAEAHAHKSQAMPHRGGKASPYATPEAQLINSPAARRSLAAQELNASGPIVEPADSPAARRAAARAELADNGPLKAQDNISPGSLRAKAALQDAASRNDATQKIAAKSVMSDSAPN